LVTAVHTQRQASMQADSQRKTAQQADRRRATDARANVLMRNGMLPALLLLPARAMLSSSLLSRENFVARVQTAKSADDVGPCK